MAGFADIVIDDDGWLSTSSVRGGHFTAGQFAAGHFNRFHFPGSGGATLTVRPDYPTTIFGAVRQRGGRPIARHARARSV